MLNGKIDRKDLFDFLKYQGNIDTAKEVFGDTQPRIVQTGWYSTNSWNWAYQVGFCDVVRDEEIKIFEVVTQFGEVKAARQVFFYNTK